MAEFDFKTVFEGTDKLNKGLDGTVDVDSLNGKDVVALYFSAHWCGPCRNFTPVLIQVYNDLLIQGKSFEVVFVSADHDDASFASYYGTMPWLAVPFAERDLEEKLSARFKCNGIPHLVLLNGKTGEIITDEGTSVIQDYRDAGFPYDKGAIASITSIKFEGLLRAFDHWNLFAPFAPESFSLLNKEVVGVFVGSYSGDAKYVCPALTKAFESLSDRMSVVYLPYGAPGALTDQGQVDFENAMPVDWIKVPHEAAAGIANILISALPNGQLDNPGLFIVNGACNTVLVGDACRIVYRYKQSGFPWTEEALAEFEREKLEKIQAYKAAYIGCGGLKFFSDFGANIVDHAGNSVAVEKLLENDLVGLYFSAHWCGPCRSFTPKFVEEYAKLKAAGKKVEVVFISSDRDQESFNSYFAEMPWLALDFAQRKVKNAMSEGFEVDGIPTLIWIDPSNGVSIEDGHSTIILGSEYFPWTTEKIAEGNAAMLEKKRKALEDELAAEATVQRGFLEAGNVVLRNHRGRGIIKGDYSVEFKGFNTVVADVKLRSGGKYYYEIEVVTMGVAPQMGWVTEGFKSSANSNGTGVGDDAFGWAIDGHRQQKWHGGCVEYGTSWSAGDFIGCAIDLSSDGPGCMTFSVNGCFDAPNGEAFQDIRANWVSPGLTSQTGTFRPNFGDRLFRFAPPDASFMSVHDAAKL